MARHNAEVYGVADKIEFIVGDFFEVGPKIKVLPCTQAHTHTHAHACTRAYTHAHTQQLTV